MNLGLKGKPVLVLAASDGLGKAAAMEFAGEGARVMLFARSEDRLQRAQKEISEATGEQPGIVVGDITVAADVQNAVATTAQRFGSVFALVNNSGGPPAGGFDAFDEAALGQAVNAEPGT